MNLLILCALLLPLLAPSTALASESAGNTAPPATDKAPAVRYFQYTARYGNKAARPGAYRTLAFKLMNERIYIVGIPPAGSDFHGQTDKAAGRDLAKLATGLDVKDWENASYGSDFPRPQDEDVACIWSLDIVFAEDTLPRIRLSGYDDGSSPKRLAAEAALLRFFTPKRDAGLASTPRQIDSITYGVNQADGNSLYYNLTAEGNMVRLSRSWNGGGKFYPGQLPEKDNVRRARSRNANRVESYVTPDMLSRALELVQNHKLDAWNGLRTGDTKQKSPASFSLWIKFSTEQTISAQGNQTAPEETPPGFAQADAALRGLFDKALGLAADGHQQDTVPARVLFSFSEDSMSSCTRYEIYQRRDLQGVPQLLLRRQLGRNLDEADEVPFTDECAAGLERVVKEQNLADWNGFRRTTSGVLDGYSFGLSIQFAAGSSISAGGSNAFPKGYQNGKSALLHYLDQCIDKAPR